MSIGPSVANGFARVLRTHERKMGCAEVHRRFPSASETRAWTPSLTMNLDVLIVGAGAAGLMCAIEAGKRGRKVLVIDHAQKPAEKVRISGGGRCNFTNRHTAPEYFLSQNPRFCISALARYPAQAFIDLVEKHGIAYHEKTLGQLFCDRSAQQIVNMLLKECNEAGVTIRLGTEVTELRKESTGFRVRTTGEDYFCASLVIASGGLSIPKMKASGFGYAVARQFGLRVVPTKPALVPFTLPETELRRWKDLAGVSLRAEVRCGRQSFREGMVFTHRGISGPAILQISSYWEPSRELQIDLAPGAEAAALLKERKIRNLGAEVATVLTDVVPKRLAQRIVATQFSEAASLRLAEIPDRNLDALSRQVHDWRVVPNGTEGYRVAEVTMGGIDTDELSSQTMASREVENLYFIGEVVDVTGHLGGFNFQWAWASGYAAGQYA